MPERRVHLFLLPVLLLLAACSDGRNASIAVRLTYPQEDPAPAAAASSGGAARPMSVGTASPAYVQEPGNRILIRVLAPHLPAPIEAWFDRSAGRGEISGIPPGDRIVVEVDEYDGTAVSLPTTARLLGRGWAQGLTLGAGERKTVAVPMYGKGTIVRICGAAPNVDNTPTAGDSGDGGLADNATLGDPLAVKVGPGDELFVSSARSNRVRRIDRYGYIAHYAGKGDHGALTEGAPAATSPIGGVFDIDIDTNGTIFLINWWQEIVKVDPSLETISTSYGGETFNPTARPNLAVAAADEIFFTNAIDNNVYRVQGGVATSFIANNPGATEAEGVLPTASVLRTASGIAVGPGTTGIVYCSKDSNRIKRLDFGVGLIYTLVGSDAPLPYADNIARTDMSPQRPYLVEFDRFGGRRYFFAEEGSQTIKSVRLDVTPNTVWTLAGNGTAGYSGDGGPATAARLSDPRSVTTDSRGNVYIADTGNHAVRMVVGGALP